VILLGQSVFAALSSAFRGSSLQSKAFILVNSFLDAEQGMALVALDDLQTVAGNPDQMGNVDECKRVRAAHFQKIARRQEFEGFARLQRRKGALQSRQIQLRDGHGSTCAKRWPPVNRLPDVGRRLR
jgi:hypothetical protein